MAQLLAPVFGLGTDGDLLISGDTTDSPIDSACTGTISTTSLSATNASFAAGQIIIIHQTKGASGTGNWELNQIASYSVGTITLRYPLVTGFVSGAQVMVVKQYRSFTVNSGINFYAKAYDGTVGGIMMFLIQGKMSIVGNLKLNGRGFRGGLEDTSGNDWGGKGGEGLAGVSGQGGWNGSTEAGGFPSGGGKGTSGGGTSAGGATGTNYTGGGGGGGDANSGNDEAAGGGGGGGHRYGGGGGGSGTDSAGAGGLGGASNSVGGGDGGGNGANVAGAASGSQSTNQSGVGGIGQNGAGLNGGGGGGGANALTQSDLSKIFMGGGGGAGGRYNSGVYGVAGGDGGNGGAIGIFYANTISFTGLVEFYGDNGTVRSAGGGGGAGGAGGSLFLRGNYVDVGSNRATGYGGSGGQPSHGGDGGYGSEGMCRIEANTIVGTTNPTFNQAIGGLSWQGKLGPSA